MANQIDMEEKSKNLECFLDQWLDYCDGEDPYVVEALCGDDLEKYELLAELEAI